MDKPRDGNCAFFLTSERREIEGASYHSAKANPRNESIGSESALTILHLDGSSLKNRIVTLTLKDSCKNYTKYLASAQDNKNLIAVL